jgi:hypothetical protein
VRARSAAEIIRLPPNIFRYRHSPWNKYLADGILNHVIFTRGEKVRLALAFFELSQGTPEEKIQHYK